jgi:hypothetical protein
MNRAAVLIGVNRTGALPVLQDAGKSARRMEQWARAQGVENIKVLTDDDGNPVEVSAIKRAIRELNDLGTVEQLIVFFAGHGINVSRGERWLLSDAPADPDAAVNVVSSVDLARWGGIPYVVMISDACRTAADGIQAQGVTGSAIFPNEEIADLELPVDQFFACKLGEPSHEIADPATTAKEYTGIYTRALVTALEGADPDALDRQGYVRPRPLKKFLQREVAARLRALELQTRLIQVPDARISSDERAWLSRVPRELAVGGAVHRGGAAGMGGGVSGGGGAGAPRTPRTALDDMLLPILADRMDDFDAELLRTQQSDEPSILDLTAAVATTASPFGPTHYETRCGFKVRGARVREAVAARLQAERFSDELVRVDPRGHDGGDVLLVLDDGQGVALPAIPEFLAAVTIQDGEVVDVAYEPSEGTWRWGQFVRRAHELRALRAVAAAASREGTFSLEGDDALAVARRLQIAKGVDPALAIYAAYAYADNGRRDLIHDMRNYMREDLGAVLFDVALLARERRGRRDVAVEGLLGFAPLLAQGWALLPTSRMTLPSSLHDLGRHVSPSSLWTMYDPGGVDRIRNAFAMGDLT